MGGKWIEKRISIEPVMAFDPDLEGAIARRSRHAQNNIAIVDLTIVEGHLGLLINAAREEFCCARYTAAIFTPVWQINALIAQAHQQCSVRADLIGRVALVGDGNRVRRHSHISLVQSPPG